MSIDGNGMQHKTSQSLSSALIENDGTQSITFILVLFPISYLFIFSVSLTA